MTLNPLPNTGCHLRGQHANVENEGGSLKAPVVHLTVRRWLREREPSVASLSDTRASLMETLQRICQRSEPESTGSAKYWSHHATYRAPFVSPSADPSAAQMSGRQTVTCSNAQ